MTISDMATPDDSYAYCYGRLAELDMARKGKTQFTVTLRYSGENAYWLTVEPRVDRYPDVFCFSRLSVYQTAIAVLQNLEFAVCKDESAPTSANQNSTALFFASRQPWASNSYCRLADLPEPTFFDANLLRSQ